MPYIGARLTERRRASVFHWKNVCRDGKPVKEAPKAGNAGQAADIRKAGSAGHAAVGSPATLRLTLSILRQSSPESEPYWQTIPYETDDPGETVASALTKINEAGDIRDERGEQVEPIVWECSCLQKRCGACAMVIDGRPALACGVFLREHKGKKPLTVEPLRKFPVIRDLQVDRSVLFQNLKEMALWAEEKAEWTDGAVLPSYEASRCLQCGCCLEVCPNVDLRGPFFGAAGFVPSMRLLASLPEAERARLRESYLAHAYAGCGKSLACQNVCPAGIPIERLLVRTNGAVLKKK